MKRDRLTSRRAASAAIYYGLLSIGFGVSAACGTPEPEPPECRWWKGNLHTHTLWWGGDEYPEIVADWYKENGYHFLALSDHNILSAGQKWIDPASHPHAERTGGMAGFERYRERFGDDWVETRDKDGTTMVRLKPFDEFRRLFEEPGRFLMMQGLEITEYIHMNATNIVELVEPHGGENAREIIESNVASVLDQRRRTGQAMFPHLNHPNWRWRVTAEDFASVRDLRFFEVYGGPRGSRDDGDEIHKSTDRMWDIALTLRLGEHGFGLLYGLAGDDAHDYEHSNRKRSVPGRGWVTVRAKRLTPEHLIGALEAGEFYASTGVVLRNVDVSEESLSIEIEPEQDVSYATEFIGTRRGYDRSSEPIRDAQGNELPVTRRYSEDIGAVFKSVEGPVASYTFQGDELYVRARVVSSREKKDYGASGEMERAWIQPVAVNRRP